MPKQNSSFICKTKSSTFTNLFLDLQQYQEDDDDDTLSLTSSSVEEEADEEQGTSSSNADDPPAVEPANDEQQQAAQEPNDETENQNIDSQETNRPDVIEIDLMTILLSRFSPMLRHLQKLERNKRNRL